MSDLEREKRELPCPKCKREIEVTFRDILTSREAKCRRCGSMYKFDSINVSDLRRAISNLEKAQKEFAESFQKLIQKADIVLKQ